MTNTLFRSPVIASPNGEPGEIIAVSESADNNLRCCCQSICSATSGDEYRNKAYWDGIVKGMWKYG